VTLLKWHGKMACCEHGSVERSFQTAIIDLAEINRINQGPY